MLLVYGLEPLQRPNGLVLLKRLVELSLPEVEVTDHLVAGWEVFFVVERSPRGRAGTLRTKL